KLQDRAGAYQPGGAIDSHQATSVAFAIAVDKQALILLGSFDKFSGFIHVEVDAFAQRICRPCQHQIALRVEYGGFADIEAAGEDFHDHLAKENHRPIMESGVDQPCVGPFAVDVVQTSDFLLKRVEYAIAVQLQPANLELF